MALTKEQKEQIEVEMGDFTHAELAAKYKCSRSTIARVCAAAKAQDTQRSSEAAVTTSSNDNNDNDTSNNGDPQDKFTYTPETEERQTIELENDEGLGRLLSSHAQLDPIADIEEEEKGDDAEGGNKGAEGAGSPDEQDKVLGELIDEAEAAAAAPMNGPSESEVDSMLKGLLGSEDLDDEPSPPPRLTSRKTKTKASSPSSFSTTGIIRSTTKAAPTSFSAVSAPGGGGGKFAHLPASVLVTQCKLYLTHFSEALECITGKTAQEKDRYIKAIKVNMPREELLGVLSSIRGTITLSTSCSTIRNSLMCGAGLAESVAPMVGMNLTNVTKHLDDRRDEIQLACTQMVLDDFDWWEQKQSGKSQLFFICANTIFTCDAANRSHAAQQQAAAMAAQPISPAVQNKYNTL